VSLNSIVLIQSTVLQTNLQSSAGRLGIEWAAALILFFIAVFAIHGVRRAYRQPTRVGGTPVEVPGNKVKAFDIVDRAFHWSLFIILGLVMLTGVAIYSPGTFDSFLEAFGVTAVAASATTGNIAWHTDMLWILLGLIIIHVVYDLAVTRSGKSILPGSSDFKDTTTRLKGFLGFGPSVQPRHGKYDAFMKLFHWGLALCLVILGITGLYLWNPYGLMPTMSPGFESTLRLLHDVFAFLLIGLVMGHIYFAILPINWPVLRSIFLGTISGDAYNHDFDSNRWSLKKKVAPVKAPAADAAAAASTPAPSAGGGAPTQQAGGKDEASGS